MTLQQVLASILGSALLFKFAVFIFSPESENSLGRAFLTSVAGLGAVMLADVLPQFGVAPWVGTAVFLLAPLVIIKMAYTLSVFRTLLVWGLYLALYSGVSHLASLRVVSFELSDDSAKEPPKKRSKSLK